MKPIIQGALDALAGRISVLESGARTIVANATALAGLLTATSGSFATTVTALTTLIGTGRLWANRQVLTSSGTYTPTSGTKRAIVRMVGGGGGGGGANSTIGPPDSTGAGGGSGWYLELRVSGSNGANITGGAYSCGAGGSGGSTAPGAGGNGGSTSLTINGQTFTAVGGAGGGALLDNNGAPTAPFACPSTASADFFCYGPGSAGIPSGGGLAYCGQGGSVHPFGSGGYQANAGPAQGGPGLGFGAGGGGGAADFFSVAGAPGSPGIIVIEEFV